MAEDKTEAEGSQGGEGDRESDRRYRKDARKFVAEDRVDEAAEKARNMSEEEASESLAAEKIGKSHARDEDPETEHKTGQ